jgi:hypothetical protein
MQRDVSPPSAPLTFVTFMLLLASIKNWEPDGVMFPGYCYTIRHRMKFQVITLYCFSHLQRYGIMIHGSFTSVYQLF